MFSLVSNSIEYSTCIWLHYIQTRLVWYTRVILRGVKTFKWRITCWWPILHKAIAHNGITDVSCQLSEVPTLNTTIGIVQCCWVVCVGASILNSQTSEILFCDRPESPVAVISCAAPHAWADNRARPSFLDVEIWVKLTATRKLKSTSMSLTVSACACACACS